MPKSPKFDINTPVSRPVAVITILIFLLNLIIFYFSRLQGDDLAYTSLFDGPNRLHEWWGYPRWCAVHWLTTNGRFANYLMPAMGVAPAALRALLFATAVALMYLFSAKIAGVRKGFLPALLCLGISLGLPWWDFMVSFDVQLNFIWASTFVLAAFWLIHSGHEYKGGKLVVACLFCIVAGSMHETPSAGLLAGWLAYFLFRRLRPTQTQKWLLAAFAIGALEAIFAPGIIMRARGVGSADDSLLLLFLKSDILAGLLWAVILVFAMIPACRRFNRDLFATPYAVLVIAALVQIPIGLYSGIVGRPGWWAELFSMIVAVGWAGMYIRPCNRLLTWLFGGLALVPSASAAYVAPALAKELDSFVEEFRESPDGVVYMDPTPDTALPVSALNRMRGVPDADDFFQLECVGRHNRADKAWPVVLPTAFRDKSPEELRDDYLILPYLPQGALAAPFGGPSYRLIYQGKQMIALPFKGQWYLCERYFDPGDREFELADPDL